MTSHASDTDNNEPRQSPAPVNDFDDHAADQNHDAGYNDCNAGQDSAQHFDIDVLLTHPRYLAKNHVD